MTRKSQFIPLVPNKNLIARHIQKIAEFFVNADRKAEEEQSFIFAAAAAKVLTANSQAVLQSVINGLSAAAKNLIF